MNNPPERFGAYTLLHRLAQGGMAEIFLAQRERAEGELVVIKRLREDRQDDPEQVKMLVDEEAILSRLDHPGIVRALEIGKAEGRYFIALEHIWGETLYTLLLLCQQQQVPFPLRAALYVGAQLARALEHAHSARLASGAAAPVVHRDVTLANVLISYAGEVKLLDFGIAHSSGRLAETQLGLVKGTLEYQAPEQVAGEAAGPGTDLYQLGVLLYKILVGCSPVEAEDEAELLGRIREGAIVPPGARLPGFPIAVEKLLLRALALRPADRFASAGEMAEALQAELGKGWDDGGAGLAAMLDTLAGERHRRQQAVIAALCQGQAAGADATLIERSVETEEPARLNVELSTFLDVVSDPADRESRADLPFVSAELLAVEDPDAAEATTRTTSTPPAAATPEQDAGPEDERIGAYRVLAPLGGGPLGESFRCQDPELSREVVVKLLRPELAEQDAARSQFIASARGMARADAAELVTVYRVGEHQGRPYLAVEQLAGQDLAGRLSAGPLEVREALALVQRAALALHKLASRDLHHGNLKPSNLFVDDTALRFGDAGMFGHADPGEQESTEAGGYRAPELVTGGAPDSAADVYALGAILFHCVMGFPPGSATPAEQQLAGLPPQLTKVLRHMLATDPAERFGSAEALARALDGLIDELGPAKAARPAAAAAAAPAPAPTTPAVAQPEAVRPSPNTAPSASVPGTTGRRRWLPLVAAAVVAVLIVASALLLRGEDWAGRLAAGEAAEVRAEIEAIAMADREAEDELYLGHALNDLKDYNTAFEAYARAIPRGAWDARARAFMLEELDSKQADDTVEVFRSWPGDSVNAPLVQLAEGGRRWERHHALRALRARKQEQLVDLQKIGLRDLREGRRCEARRRGVRLLIEAGRDDTALAAVRQAKGKIFDNMCMQRELEQAERAIARRMKESAP